jgi:hypothetical protein
VLDEKVILSVEDSIAVVDADELLPYACIDGQAADPVQVPDVSVTVVTNVCEPLTDVIVSVYIHSWTCPSLSSCTTFAGCHWTLPIGVGADCHT